MLAEAVNRMLDEMQRTQAVEEKVRKVQKMEAVGSLAVGIAHDFNNMLYVISGYATMLKQRVHGDPASCEYLEKIVKAGEQSSNLVRQLMAFGRRDEQGACRFSLASIVKEAMMLFRAMVPATIQIQKHLLVQDDVIVADPAQIYQMVMNLYLNAFHAMREKGGVLTITTELRQLDEFTAGGMPQGSAAKWLCLSVADTGCGIPEGDVARVFDPYFTTKPIGEGSGLGLSVVRHIVESAGGHVKVVSQAGSGTVLSVYFPLADLVQGQGV
jgi:signal transduction histidine kinase